LMSALVSQRHDQNNVMRRITALLLGCMLSASFAFAGEPNSADQKWLQAVEKMVFKGETKISTPIEGRVSLLKEWANKKGYSAKVTKTHAGFAIELSAKEMSKPVAQK
jgi:hypothetical protein